MSNYIMYHSHSDYSLLDSCTHYQDYIDLAVENHQPALAISEHGKPLNWTEKWWNCKQAGIKFMHAVEIYLTESLDEKVRDNYHTVLIARNEDGVHELNKLIEVSTNEDHFYYVNRISFDEFLNLSENIITTSACLASPLNKLPKDHPRYMELARKYDFLEVQAHKEEDQIAYNKRLLELSKEIGTPLIAGTDTHNSSPYKAECRTALLVENHKSYGSEDKFDLTYKTYDQLVEMFDEQEALPRSEYMQAIENTNMLYDMTEEIEMDTSIKYPILYGSREKDSEVFLQTIDKKFNEKLDKGIIPKEQEQPFRDAMKEEVRVFQKLHMDGFMLSMSEIVSWCKEQGFAIGTARGSVGGSRVAYVTDITDLNPETWHTVFSRFCNEDREEIGDIDIDCVKSDRPAIFQYIRSRFGEDKTAKVASFSTIQDKGVIDHVGRYLAIKWAEEHPSEDPAKNPWSLSKCAKIKELFTSDPEKAKEKYPEMFYYYDGMLDVKTAQSVHPAGMVISPITLDDNYGCFWKDGEKCLILDMDNIHDFTGLAKYDLLILKTVEVIRDTCKYIGCSYPKSHEIDWNDQRVWKHMVSDPTGIFQFEGKFAFDSLKKFEPHSIFDMALVNACVRPSGASYRDDLLEHKVHHNPSKLIDDILAGSLGYLCFQEDTIKFLQDVCGLSGSEADNIRRAIGRKQKDRLERAMPSILKGYCEKSDKPEEVAKQEAKDFLQVIEDSADYQFGYNHSIAYCLLGYLCAYYRCYYPIEFLTAFLNNAANNDDITNGTKYADKIGIKVVTPKWGISKSDYYYDKEQGIISKGLSSIKYMSQKTATELYEIANSGNITCFSDVLDAIRDSSIDSRNLETLIKIDFFSAFGNQRELTYMYDVYHNLLSDCKLEDGKTKQLSKEKINGTIIEESVAKYGCGVTKTGKEAKAYTIKSKYLLQKIMREAEQGIKNLGMKDIGSEVKAYNFKEAAGYAGYVSGEDADRPKLYISNVYPLYRKKDHKLFGHSVVTESIGSGIKSRFTVFNTVFDKNPIEEGDVIYCRGWRRDKGVYFVLTSYEILVGKDGKVAKSL